MIGHLTIPKIVAAIGAVIGGLEAIQSGAQGVILAAATVAAFAYLWVKVIRPTRRFGQRIVRAVDLLEHLPAWQAEVRERLDKHGEALDVIAETDRYRIKDALAGDKRSPVDRRAA